MEQLEKSHQDDELTKAKEIEDSIAKQELADEKILSHEFTPVKKEDPLNVMAESDNMEVHH